MNRTYRFNPLDRRNIKDRTMLMQLMEDVLGALMPPTSKQDEWYTGALGILNGVAYRLWDEFPECCTLPHIVNFVMKADTGQLQEFLKLNDISAMMAGAYLKAEGSEKQASMCPLSNYVAKLATNENICYVLTGNDFDFNLIDPEHPKLFAISNNYATESVISPVIAMVMSIASRSFSMENRVPFVLSWTRWPPSRCVTSRSCLPSCASTGRRSCCSPSPEPSWRNCTANWTGRPLRRISEISSRPHTGCGGIEILPSLFPGNTRRRRSPPVPAAAVAAVIPAWPSAHRRKRYMNRRTSLHWNQGNLSEWETVPISKGISGEEVQAVRTGGGTAAGSRVQDGEGNIWQLYQNTERYREGAWDGRDRCKLFILVLQCIKYKNIYTP